MQEAFAVHKSTAKVRLRVCVLRVPLVSNFIGTKITVANYYVSELSPLRNC